MYKLAFIFLFLNLSISAQDKIHFVEMRLDNAISQAQKQNKPLFIDTYARYCIPCKQMEKEFSNPEVAAFFNKHFLNVRVNMETSYADPFKLAYQIVYLPTFIFANKEGEEKIKIDNIISGRELLAFGKHVINNSKKTTSSITTQTISKDPFSSSTLTPVSVKTTSKPKPSATKPIPTSTEEDEGKILYVMGQDGQDLPPEILKEEAYFRMQLMDGSQWEASRNYLATQEDWNSVDNIRFIHDFLNDSKSEEFEFLIDNRDRFEKVVGKEQIRQTVTILSNKELERAYPRPNYKRAVKLYSYQGTKDPDLVAAIYHMNGLYESKKTEEYLAFGAPWMMDNRMEDASMIYFYSSEKAAHHNSKEDLKLSYKVGEKALELEPKNALYHYNLAQISFLQQSKKKARKHANKAMQLVNKKTEAAANISQLLGMIEAL